MPTSKWGIYITPYPPQDSGTIAGRVFVKSIKGPESVDDWERGEDLI